MALAVSCQTEPLRLEGSVCSVAARGCCMRPRHAALFSSLPTYAHVDHTRTDHILSVARASDSVDALLKKAGFTSSSKRGRSEGSSSVENEPAGPPSRRLRRNAPAATNYVDLVTDEEGVGE